MFHLRKKELFGASLLFLSALIWGSAFVMQKKGSFYLDTFSFNTLRAGFGVLSLLLVLKLPLPGVKSTLPVSQQRSALGPGCFAGVFLFAGLTLQQAALSFSSTGKVGMITGLYLVFIPLVVFLKGQRVRIFAWVAAVLALVGLIFLSSEKQQADQSLFNLGDLLSFLSAWCWVVYILYLSDVAPRVHALVFSIVQVFVFFVLSLLSYLLLLGFGKVPLVSLEMLRGALIPALYLGAVSTAIGFSLQTIGQRFVSASPASIILAFESVIAVIGGVLFLGEPFGFSLVVGVLLMFSGMLLSQFSEMRKETAQKK